MKVWHTKLNISPTCESISIGYDTSNRSKNVFFKVSCVDFQGRRISVEVMDTCVIWGIVPKFDTTWFDFCCLFNALNVFLVFPVRFENFDYIHPKIWHFGFVSVLRKTASIHWTTAGSIITRTGCTNWSGVHPPAVSVGVSGILNSDMKASPTVPNPYPSHPDLSRLDWEIGHW